MLGFLVHVLPAGAREMAWTDVGKLMVLHLSWVQTTGISEAHQDWRPASPINPCMHVHAAGMHAKKLTIHNFAGNLKSQGAAHTPEEKQLRSFHCSVSEVRGLIDSS